MKTIVISGAYSGIGKTQVAEELLRTLPNWSAIKITLKKDSNCPRQTNCHICDELDGEFDIVTDERTIQKKGTDTARLKRAGAKKVIWLKSTLKGLRRGFKETFGMLKGSEGVVIEGTSILKIIKPDTLIYIDDKKRPLRRAAKEARKRADIIIDVDG